MRCAACNYTDTKVVDTRVASSGLSIRRRRECEKCSHRFTTVEYMELLDMVVVKRDGNKEMYNRDKIEAGVRRSLQKRPYTSDSFNHLLCVIERDIQGRKQREVTSEQIGEIVMKRLRSFDKVGYIRFASVYRNFSDVDTFAEAAQELAKRRSKKSKKLKV
ncbi:MAG: transcriptional regulator NrdR [Parcubacteria group bacterium]|nr:transcriptional regulator NrdR [Parcubacteria group bacterium]